MNDLKQELINFRLTRANEAFDMAFAAIEKEYWNSAASELYYTCYYLVIALFARNDIKTSTHSGVKTVFGAQFVKEKIIEPKWGRLFSDLFNIRQEGDYRDFKFFTQDEILPLAEQVKEFRVVIEKLLRD